MFGCVEYASLSQRPGAKGGIEKHDAMLFNNINKKSVWAFTGIELFEITSS